MLNFFVLLITVSRKKVSKIRFCDICIIPVRKLTKEHEYQKHFHSKNMTSPFLFFKDNDKMAKIQKKGDKKDRIFSSANKKITDCEVFYKAVDIKE